jgi:hypothetical protein
MAVGIVVFTIVMGSIYGLMMVARGGRINTNQRSEIMQNARIAINAMSRDAINAGVGYPYDGANLPDNRVQTLLGTPADADPDVDVLTQVYASQRFRHNQWNPLRSGAPSCSQTTPSTAERRCRLTVRALAPM